MADIHHTIEILALPSRVYEALTTAGGIRGWWTEDADLEEVIDGKGVFRFDYSGTVETIVRIISLEANRLVQWQVETSFRPEQNGTIISFSLLQEAKITRVVFMQIGYSKADKTFDLMTTGWAYYLVSLKRLLEAGKGAPSPHLDFTIMDRKI